MLPRRTLITGAAALAVMATLCDEEAQAAFPRLRDALRSSLPRPLISWDYEIRYPTGAAFSAGSNFGATPAGFTGASPSQIALYGSGLVAVQPRCPSFDSTGTKSLGWGMWPIMSNRFVNGNAPVTQTQTITASSLCLSVVGPGSVDVSGGATGTATDGSPFLFTLAATADCTFTVNGSPLFVACTAGTTVPGGMTVVGDITSPTNSETSRTDLSTLKLPAVQSGTMVIDYMQPYNGWFGSIAALGASTSLCAKLFTGGSASQVSAVQNNLGAPLYTLTQNSSGLGLFSRVAFAFDKKGGSLSVNGQAPSVSATVSTTTTNYATLLLGCNNFTSLADQLGGYIRRFRLYGMRLPNALLPQISRIMQT